MRQLTGFAIALLTLALLACESNSKSKTAQLPQTTDKEVKAKSAALPGVTLNRAEGFVDLNATVALRDGLLELVACTSGTKEHESLFAIAARPRHVHLALLLLGLEPGKPSGGLYEGDTWVGIPAAGPKVAVSVVHDGKEIPVQQFVRGEKPDDRLADNVFLFAGSIVEEADESRSYAADESGNVISLVAFGDEVLALPTPASADNDMLMWQANTAKMPPLSTAVKIRLRPLK